ncbi:MCM3 [Hepatospora eriocheir]|uniref:MCM3 n=1 Tax=Hepatospora eriocheir TaxID=1081669 RepID=A0A1X0QFL8_9MICR|nr:MCM3 [Hepatospora eriocheir]
MDVNDRVAIHEVMEQQTISIAKAGIHTTLNARCSVLAAANPVLGRFDSKKSVQYNVNLPDKLLTRFDLVFITLDTNVNDYDISNHILKMHADDNRSNNEDIVSSELFKRFINHAKKIRPALTDDSALLISKSYFKLREDNKGFVIPITLRVLETLIRLSTAYAKLRLSETVDECDVDEAFKLFNFTKNNSIFRVKRSKNIIVKENDIFNKENIENVQREKFTGITEARKNSILEIIWNWKDKNSHEDSCSIKMLAERNKIDIEEIRTVVDELASQDFIIKDEDNIYFLD